MHDYTISNRYLHSIYFYISYYSGVKFVFKFNYSFKKRVSLGSLSLVVETFPSNTNLTLQIKVTWVSDDRILTIINNPILFYPLY